MMLILSAEQMREIDKQAIDVCGIPSLELMENAGRAAYSVIREQFAGASSALIVAGKGNNGGDGCVVARLLLDAGWNISLLLLAEPDQLRGDAAINLDRLPPSCVTSLNSAAEMKHHFVKLAAEADIIVDAIFGTGLDNSMSGVHLVGVDLINSAALPVVSLDIPSGINGTTGRVMGGAVRATTTVAFAFAKLGHILHPGVAYTGKLVVADIGIPSSLADESSSQLFLDFEAVRPMLASRDKDCHKGVYGHCLIVAGSTGKSGAAALAANSAVRSGAGLVTLAIPSAINSILEVKTTEAMTLPLADNGSGQLLRSALGELEQLLPGKGAVAIGPGIGRSDETAALVCQFAAVVEQPLVFDADALNALSENITALQSLKSRAVVLTPHPGEMARLTGLTVAQIEMSRIDTARDFARKHTVYLILKGSRTVIASPSGAVAINGSGNPGMASGGMGDVLTGMLVALLGQGYGPWDACCIGVFLHGVAADLVAADRGEIGITATDVIERAPYAFKKVLEVL